jgi:hypothetical protein
LRKAACDVTGSQTERKVEFNSVGSGDSRGGFGEEVPEEHRKLARKSDGQGNLVWSDFSIPKPK